MTVAPTQRGLFITGTDTGVGKTHVTVMLAERLRAEGVTVGVYKPAVSGSREGRWADVELLSAAIGGGVSDDRICPQRFAAPLAPPEAAKAEGRSVDAALLRSGAAWWTGRVELLLVEGVGGLLCPLTETETVADLAADLGWPLLIVARAGLGTINHTLLTLDVARRRGLEVTGVLLNEPDPPPHDDRSSDSNARRIEQLGRVRVLGQLDHGGTADDLLPPTAGATIDWLAPPDPSAGATRPDPQPQPP